MSKRNRGPLGLLIDFVWTGEGFENKRRFYFVLGAATLGLAAIFGAILIIGALFMVIQGS